MKKLAMAATVVFVLAGAAIVGAQAFDEESGTAAVMVSGGTLYEDNVVGPQRVTTTSLVGTVTVPAGRYVVEATAWIDRLVGSSTFVQCGFDNGVAGSGATRLAGDDDYVPVVASGSDEFETETDIDYVCVTDDDIDVHRVVVTAITVSAINAQ
jgi:hypothetical protein